MKKIISILLAILVVGCIGMEAKTTKKSGKKKSTTSSSIMITKGETNQYGDYLTTQIFTASKGKNKKLILEYPISGDPQLVEAIRQYLAEQITGSNNRFDSPEQLLRKCTELKEGSSRDEFDETVTIIYSDPNIITYYIDGYLQEYGTYQPYVRNLGETFLIETGEALSDVLKPDLNSLYKYMINNIDADEYVVEDYRKDLIEYGFGGYFFITDEGLEFTEFMGMDNGLNYNGGWFEGIIPIYEIIDVVSSKAQKFLK